jgi:drug/metabolite transporter (DMT)-like permease
MKAMQVLLRLWFSFLALGVGAQLHSKARTPRSVAKPSFLSAKTLAAANTNGRRSSLTEDDADTLLQTSSNSLFAVAARQQTQTSMALAAARERQITATRLAIVVSLGIAVVASLGYVWLSIRWTLDPQQLLTSIEKTPCKSQGSDHTADGPPPSVLMKGILMGLLHIVVSTAMILFNKYLMNPQRFPHAVPLTTMHMAFTFVFTRLLYFFKPSLFSALNVPSDIKQVHGLETVGIKQLWDFLPIGSCVALSVVTGNMAYSFSSVSFLQMLKEAVVIIVYLLSVQWGLEKFRMRNFIVLIFVTACAAVAVHGEMHFVWAGLVLQLIASMSQGAQTVLVNKLMTRTGGPKMDPLTTVLRTAPVVLLVLFPFNYIFWSPWILSQVFIFKYELLLSASLAFTLQVVNAATIQAISATGLTLAGVLKDLMIVVSAVLVLHESLTVVQVLGFSGAIVGIGVYSAMKVYPSWFERFVPSA